MRFAHFVWLLSITCLPISETCGEQNQSVPGITKAFNLTDVHGQVHQLGPTSQRTALVVVLLSTECPISNSYITLLNQRSQEWSKNDLQIDFLGFVSDRTLSRQAALKHSEEFDLKFPVIFDGSGELASLLQPTHTPEAFVLNSKGEIVYRGRIDNLCSEVGKRRQTPTTHDLQEAVTSLIKGQPVKVAYQNRSAVL